LIEQKKETLTQTEQKLNDRESHLKHKKEELDAILAETQKEEDILLKKSAEFEKKVEERLVAAYKRIRGSVKNGLAVVPIERGASAGSFFTIPPQVQLEIASRKKSSLTNTVVEFWLTQNLLKKRAKKWKRCLHFNNNDFYCDIYHTFFTFDLNNNPLS